MEIGGFMKGPCTTCEDGYIYQNTTKGHLEDQTPHKKKIRIDKRSSQYKSAIKELMDLGLTKEQAEKQFEDAETRHDDQQKEAA